MEAKLQERQLREKEEAERQMRIAAKLKQKVRPQSVARKLASNLKS